MRYRATPPTTRRNVTSPYQREDRERRYGMLHRVYIRWMEKAARLVSSATLAIIHGGGNICSFSFPYHRYPHAAENRGGTALDSGKTRQLQDEGLDREEGIVRGIYMIYP